MESTEIESEKKLARELFNTCWDLIEKPDRTPEEDQEMIRFAHESRRHWGVVGTAKEWSIGEWQCSRVNALVGNGAAALRHAQESARLCADFLRPHFMHASSCEALAFAHYVLGNFELAKEFKAKALDELVGVPEEDAGHIRDQIAELPF